MNTVKNLAIGICTVKRPDALNKALISLLAMDTPEGVNLFIIIADNDQNASAQHVVEAFRKKTDIPVYYNVEQTPGIPFARNNVLRQAGELGITELAFIDDDEVVDAKWLVNLCDYYVASGVEAVLGYVETVYSEKTPEWIIKGRYFKRNFIKTGTRLTGGATNNILFNFKKIVMDWGLSFDEKFGLSGGSDKDFFVRAIKKGAVIEFTRDAVVFEVLDKDRANLKFFVKRTFRTVNAKVNYQDLSPSQKRELLLRSGRFFVFGISVIPRGLFTGSHRSVMGIEYLVRSVGIFLGVLGIHIRWDEYSRNHKNCIPE